MALLREEVIELGVFFCYPPKMDSVKKNGKTYIKKWMVFGKDPLFSRNIHIHYVLLFILVVYVLHHIFLSSMIY